MVRCRICGGNHPFWHYLYISSKPNVEYPTCKRCYNIADLRDEPRKSRKPDPDDDDYHGDGEYGDDDDYYRDDEE